MGPAAGAAAEGGGGALSVSALLSVELAATKHISENLFQNYPMSLCIQIYKYKLTHWLRHKVVLLDTIYCASQKK